MKGDFRRTIAAHKRGAKELYTVSHRLFPVIALGAVVSALFPYVSVFFSARILSELAGARRADVLWQWVAGGVAVTGLFSLANAFLEQRKETLIDDVWGRNEP